MDYLKTSNYIFQRIGARVKRNKQRLDLTYYQLAGYANKFKYELNEPIKAWEKYDVSLLKSIAAGKAYKARNPNLISDSYIVRLTEQLEFKDELELLWGDYKDSDFVSELFENILIDILYSGDEKLKKYINDILIDYIPYSKYHSYWEIFFEHKFDIASFPNSQYKISPYFYGIKEDDIISLHGTMQLDAIKFLFNKCAKEFEDILFTFILANQKSFSKLNKKIDDFVQIEFMNVLKKYQPDEFSLGLRVRNLIISDWKNLGYFISKDMENKPETLDDRINKHLINVSLTYIDKLEAIQYLKYFSFL